MGRSLNGGEHNLPAEKELERSSPLTLFSIHYPNEKRRIPHLPAQVSTMWVEIEYGRVHTDLSPLDY